MVAACGRDTRSPQRRNRPPSAATVGTVETKRHTDDQLEPGRYVYAFTAPERAIDFVRNRPRAAFRAVAAADAVAGDPSITIEDVRVGKNPDFGVGNDLVLVEVAVGVPVQTAGVGSLLTRALVVLAVGSIALVGVWRLTGPAAGAAFGRSLGFVLGGALLAYMVVATGAIGGDS